MFGVAFWQVAGEQCGQQVASWKALEPYWNVLGALGCVLGALGAVLVSLGDSWGALGGLLGALGRVLGALVAVLEVFWTHLGSSGVHLESKLGGQKGPKSSPSNNLN